MNGVAVRGAEERGLDPTLVGLCHGRGWKEVEREKQRQRPPLFLMCSGHDGLIQAWHSQEAVWFPAGLCVMTGFPFHCLASLPPVPSQEGFLGGFLPPHTYWNVLSLAMGESCLFGMKSVGELYWIIPALKLYSHSIGNTPCFVKIQPGNRSETLKWAGFEDEFFIFFNI